MELFLDSVAIEDIVSVLKIGIIDGATTNPALISKMNVNSYREGIESIISAMGPNRKVFAEVLSLTEADMYLEAKEIASWGPNMVIKLPAMNEGISAIRRLSDEGIACATTMIYSPSQAIMSAKAGAKYVAVFLARAYQVGIDGMAVISDIAKAFSTIETNCSILAASIRTPLDFSRSIIAGATSAAIPGSTMLECSESPCTQSTLSNFLDLWNATGKKGVFKANI